MNSKKLWTVCIFALVAMGFGFCTISARRTAAQVSSKKALLQTPETPQRRVLAVYSKLPLRFEANAGQTDPQVKFLSRGRGYTLFLTSTEAVFTLNGPKEKSKDEQQNPNQNSRSRSRTAASVLRMELVGAAKEPRVVGLQQLPGKSNYLLGNDPKRWHRNIASYAQVKYEQVYPGVDLVFHGRQHQLEYDFELGPGADPRAIRLMFDGAEALRLDEHGDLVMGTAGGEFRQHAPLIYQRINGERHQVSGGYTLEAGGQLSFRLGAYDPQYALTIDPTLSYSTFLGGNDDDQAAGIALDSAGNAYITGNTSSLNFPLSPGAYQSTCGGCPGESDAFITKLDPTGSTLLYSTYLGGTDSDEGLAITVDSSGSAYVAGDTFSADFPTTPGAFQTTFGDGRCGIPPNTFPCADGFVAKLDPTGSSLVYSTYLGGSNADEGTGIAVDSSGNAYVTGDTASADFPTTPGAFQTALGGGACSSGPCPDAFVTKLDPTGSTLIYSTYLGGGDRDEALGIAVDSSGSAYVTGDTASADFPTTPGAFQTALGGGTCFGRPCPDAFITKLDPTGSTLVYSTYLGGNNDDQGVGIAVDASGNAYVAGNTSSANFPTKNPVQPSFGGGAADAFVTALNPSASALVYSTYLGGNNEDLGVGIAVDGSGNAYVTGSTKSANFRTTPGVIQPTFGGGTCGATPCSDGFVAKVSP